MGKTEEKYKGLAFPIKGRTLCLQKNSVFFAEIRFRQDVISQTREHLYVNVHCPKCAGHHTCTMRKEDVRLGQEGRLMVDPSHPLLIVQMNLYQSHYASRMVFRCPSCGKWDFMYNHQPVICDHCDAVLPKFFDMLTAEDDVSEEAKIDYHFRGLDSL